MMRLKIGGMVTLLFLLSSCVSLMGVKYQYMYVLKEPYSSNMQYGDETINIHFAIADTSIVFTMKNVTNDIIKIIWDEASFVQRGNAQRIMHVGVKYSDRNSSQPPTIIPPGVSIEDNVIPVNNVYWRDGYYSKYSSSPGGWEERDLLPTQDFNKVEFSNMIMNSKGQQFSLFIPIEYSGVKKTYKFVFEVSNVNKVESKYY